MNNPSLLNDIIYWYIYYLKYVPGKDVVGNIFEVVDMLYA